ncbi:4-alpha-glucanotransferase [Chenggangzhangella methanolivorans]|uniref:4-alpha-glucanotransferase n=1 Tax=Chenggangzhangella methanolivorans TaxID=1437009 RepID=A0A9E6R6V8_9HYPH|nr:4-alpha-glucanotransferase [Chenggangzhangella methanolivorans]QZN99317.1 4-alpha-glucanotransferase [Chenggangzhangella methanolivorans]
MTTDDLVRRLATRAGFAVHWTDQAGKAQEVSPETLKRLLAALGVSCETEAQARDALASLDAADRARPPLVTARVGEPFDIPEATAVQARLTREDGEIFEFMLQDAGDDRARARPILEPGYHQLEFGDEAIVVAVSPGRGRSIVDAGQGRRMWGLASQVYGLTRKGDGGIGDLGGVAALAEAAAAAGADALALSPLHAGFSADPHHFGPYSPSSRLFLNPLHADPDFLFGEERVREAAKAAGVAAGRAKLEKAALVDWPGSAAVKLATLRTLHDSFRAVELGADTTSHLALDYAAYLREGGALLIEHARFEALHAARFGADPGQWDWRRWPEGLKDPNGPEVEAFAREHAGEVDFHLFLQWISDRSFAAAQSVAHKAGMAIGLVSDLAVGMDAGGSHAWSRQQDVLVGLSVGSPPDLFNPNGQAWGLATFSPIALKAQGFAPFLATLRACMKNAGGVRIDHAMGFARLWMVPEGESSKHGAYLSFPVDDMLRLTALESLRNDCVVVGEDLGTVPEGFRDKLAAAGVAGMKVLQFERDDAHGFFPPDYYPQDALAMTTTHDLPTMAGWWSGADIALKASIGGQQFGETSENDTATREGERGELWRAFEQAGVARGPRPAPDETDPAVAASIRFLAATPSKLVLLPLEDALGQVEQPNLPGTLDEHPNWRRRLAKPATEMLAEPKAAERLKSLNRRREG